MYMSSIQTLAQMRSQHKCTDTHSFLQTPLPHAKSFWIVHWGVKLMPHFSPDSMWLHARQEKVREDGTQPWLISDNWKYILLKPMQRGPPSKTEETMTLGQRGTYTITFILHSACVRVCVLCRDIATFFLNFFFIKCPTHTHSHSLLQILVFTMEHVFSSWHMYMQSISLTCSGKTEGKESGGRKR